MIKISILLGEAGGLEVRYSTHMLEIHVEADASGDTIWVF
jgi:hypothetical protein